MTTSLPNKTTELDFEDALKLQSQISKAIQEIFTQAGYAIGPEIGISESHNRENQSFDVFIEISYETEPLTQRSSNKMKPKEN